MELIQNWEKLENMAIVYNLYSSGEISGNSLEAKMNCCDIAKITGEPSKCGVYQRGDKKGLKYFSNLRKQKYSVMELTLITLGSDFPRFINFLGIFYNGDYEELVDFNESLLAVCSANYSAISQYGSIKDPGLKAFIKRDKDVLKVLKAVYTTALSISWYVNPTDKELPCTRMSAKDIAEKTGVKQRKVTNILTILRLMHVIAELPVNQGSVKNLV